MDAKKYREEIEREAGLKNYRPRFTDVPEGLHVVLSSQEYSGETVMVAVANLRDGVSLMIGGPFGSDRLGKELRKIWIDAAKKALHGVGVDVNKCAVK